MSAVKRAWNRLLLKEPSWTEEEYKEAKLKRKLDIFFLSFICLSSFCKGLDQGNIKNAYVSGMQEDLHIVGNQYNLFTTFFNIGYMVVIPLSQYLMVKRIRPSLLMPCAELLWGIATGCLASVSNYRQVYGLRFLLGFAEGTAWPASVTLLTAWYGPKEIGKRLAAYEIAAYGSGMFSGFLQAGLYTNLNGAHGLAGWKWLFIVNAAITVVVAGWGFYACPDYPSRPNPWATWLDEEDVAVAQRRMARINRAQPKGWSLDTFKFVFGRPEHWAMYFYGWFANQSHYGTNYFNLWLKALKNPSGAARYSVQQLNYIPVAGSAATVVGEFIFMPLCDYVGRAWPIQLPLSTVDVVFCAIMAAWKVPDGAKFASFIWLDLTQVYQHLTVAWWAELMNESAEGRAFIIGLQTSITYAVGAGLPLAVWPASQAPVYALGWKFAVGMAVASVLCILATVWLQHRRDRLNRYKIEVASPVAEYIDEKGTPSAEEGTPMPALAPVESHIVPALRASQIESGTI